MSHEQSETIEINGKWINVYGGKHRTNPPRSLPRKYPFEKDTYPTAEEAVDAAKKRSQEEGKIPHPEDDIPSYLPPGVSVKGPWGDLGMSRQKELKILAPSFVKKRKIQLPK